jgi:hypothetical protein
MKSATPTLGHPADLAQLLRLRTLRADAAEQQVRLKRREVEAAAAAVAQRQRDIAAARDEVDRHARFSVGAGAVDLARLAPCFTAFREQIEERLERVEYGLIDDEEALETAEAELDAARRELSRAQARRDAVDDALQRSRRALVLGRERASDAELEDLPALCGPSGHPMSLLSRSPR